MRPQPHLLFLPAVDRGQQGAGDGEALHVLRPAGASPVAAVTEGAHGMRRPQAAAAPLPPGDSGIFTPYCTVKTVYQD